MTNNLANGIEERVHSVNASYNVGTYIYAATKLKYYITPLFFDRFK